MWEGGIRVGTSVSWPGVIEPKTVNKDHLSMTMDLYPTLAEIAGIPVKHELDGRSFLPVLKSEPFEENPRPVFWVRLEGNAKYGGIPYHAVRMGDWKLLRNTPFEPYQLFNLETDSGEMKEVPRKAAPKRYDELFNTLMMHVNRAGQIPWQRENP